MDKVQAEENIRMIREIMERSARYTNFSGVSGVIAGLLALAGCALTVWVSIRHIWWTQYNTYAIIWVCVFLAAVAQDAFFAHRKARKNGEKLLNPASIQVIKAVSPGVLLAVVLSLRALQLGEIDAIPVLWTLGYGVAACAAGQFSVKEVQYFGILQLVTGAVGLFLFSTWTSSILLLAVSFGIYHILFGLWMSQKYGW